jgi:predicted phosphodiesterase
VRFLCLSDIHGHADALSAVLATAERRGYSRILVAGDLCFPGPSPLDTWRRLSQLNALCVQGVGDRALATIDPTDLRPRDEHERHRLDRLIAVREELGDRILRQLARLPQMRHQPLGGDDNLLLVHGSPLDPMEPITHDMKDEAVAHLLGDDPSPIVLCGGSHVPFDRLIDREGPGLPPQTRVINLGSVGEAPAGEVPARFAHATFIESSDGGIEVEQFVVPLGRAA